MIYITGDTHSDFSRFKEENFPIQPEMTKGDYVIICGDFGCVCTFEEKGSREKDLLNYTPVFIKTEYLYNIDLEDDFFTTLRRDYLGFDKWFKNKQLKGEKAYVTTTKENKITSFLMLKEEGEHEDYSSFDNPFKPGRRIKVSTFKVSDTGKKIGKCFIKIIVNEAIRKNIDEIYITIFEKQEALIYLLERYGFKLFTHKNTTKSDGTVEKEAIYVKNLKDETQYSYVQLKEQEIFICPVIPKYHKILFKDEEKPKND